MGFLHLTSKPFFMSNGPKKKSFFGGRGRNNNYLYNHTFASRPNPPSLSIHIKQSSYSIFYSFRTPSPHSVLICSSPHLSLFREYGLQRHKTYAAADTSWGVAWCAWCCPRNFCVSACSILFCYILSSPLSSVPLPASALSRSVLLCTVVFSSVLLCSFSINPIYYFLLSPFRISFSSLVTCDASFVPPLRRCPLYVLFFEVELQKARSHRNFFFTPVIVSSTLSLFSFLSFLSFLVFSFVYLTHILFIFSSK